MSIKERRLKRRRYRAKYSVEREEESFFSAHKTMMGLSFSTSLVALLLLFDYLEDGIISVKGAQVSGVVALSLAVIFCVFAIITIVTTVKDILAYKRNK